MKIKIVATDAEKNQAFKVRNIVFVEEQKVDPAIEMDEYDNEAIHFIGYVDGEPIAASRLRWVDNFGKLERICVKKDLRGKAYGTKMIQAMEEEILKSDYTKAKLNAQTHAEEFYSRLGYETVSDEFFDAGIPHVTMVKILK